MMRRPLDNREHRGRKVLLVFWGLLSLTLWVLLVACDAATGTPLGTDSGESLGQARTQEPTVSSVVTAVSPSPTSSNQSLETPHPLPTATQVTLPMTSELRAVVVDSLPPEARVQPFSWGDIAIKSLDTHPGEPALWAAYTVGMGFFDVEDMPFVAVYAYETSWQELSRVVLTSCAEYISEWSLAQVDLDPSQIWLELQSNMGAHGGCYDLLSFDGQRLAHLVSHGNSSPGAGVATDLDGDGTQEVVLNTTENYVFCYACGVRYPGFEILDWNGRDLVPVDLEPLPDGAPSELQRLTNSAIALAEAGLWKEAQETMGHAAALNVDDSELASTVAWNARLIEMHEGDFADPSNFEVYPLLGHVFHGDYYAAVDLMRPYQVEDIWSLDSPLIVETVAQGWEHSLSEWISRTTGAALDVRSELAPAYLLRGWAAFLREPTESTSLSWVEQARALEPTDDLYIASEEHLRSVYGGRSP